MQIGIFAKTFAATGANDVLQAVRAAGYGVTQFNFACVGLPSMPDQIPAAIIEEIGLASEAAGVSIAAVSGTYNMIHPVAAKRERGLRQLAEIIEAAPEMEAGWSRSAPARAIRLINGAIIPAITMPTLGAI